MMEWEQMVENLHYHNSMPSLTSPFPPHRDNTMGLPSGGPTSNIIVSLVRDPHGSTWQMSPRLSYWSRGLW